MMKSRQARSISSRARRHFKRQRKHQGGPKAPVKYWTCAVLWLVLVAAARSDASDGGSSCRLQPTTIRITRDQNDDLGSLTRTCEGTVLVSRCEGTCISQVQPSITLPHGFLKECNCCRETYMNKREIQLQDCFDPNGQKLYGAEGSMTIFLEEPQDCSCHKCGG